MECNGCTECCKWLVFDVTTRAEFKEGLMEFYRTRGLTVIDHGKAGRFGVVVQSYCPSLMDSGCALHGTELKPKVCQDYRCEDDVYLPNNPSTRKDDKWNQK